MRKLFILCIAFLTIIVAQAQINSPFTSGSFSSPVSINSRYSVACTAVADFDGDGKSDVAIASGAFYLNDPGTGNLISTQYFVSVFKNTSSGSSVNFGNELDIPVAGAIPYNNANSIAPKFIKVADMNGDGKLDIVVLGSANGVTVLRNTSSSGVISFAAPISFSIGEGNQYTVPSNYAYPGFNTGLVLADINNDGKTDILVSSYSGDVYATHNTGDIQVLYNHSSSNNLSFNLDYGLLPSNAYPDGEVSPLVNPITFEVADFDGDGNKDIIIVDNRIPTINSSLNGRYLRVFKNNGISSSGLASCNTETDIALTNDVTSILISDINNDGKPDFITGGNISTLYINGSTSSSFLFGPAAFGSGNSVTIGDLNGDGKRDIATITSTNGTPYTASIYRNINTTNTINASSLAAPVSYNFGNANLLMADFNGDGKMDLICGNQILINHVNEPKIFSFTPTSGRIGTSLTITGENLNNVTNLSIGGTSISSFTIVNSTTITATLNACYFGNVKVSSSGFSDSLSGFNQNFNGSTSPGTITGPANVCANSSTNFSITPVAGASSYVWTLPSGWSGSSSTNSIHVNINNISGSISVVANNGCGSTMAAEFATHVINIPLTPATIFGQRTIVGGTTHNYTVASVDEALGYSWSLPSNWSGSSQSTSNSITADNNSGTISVNAYNACGHSSAQNLDITVLPLPTVSTTPASNISLNTATVGGSVDLSGSLPLLQKGVVYNTNGNPTTNDNISVAARQNQTTGLSNAPVSTGTFSVDLTGLESGTLYYARAYGTDSAGTAYGDQVSFTTQYETPVLNSFYPVSAYPGTTITISGSHFNGTSAVSFGGFPAVSFSVINSSTITAVVDTGYSGEVAVTTPGGTVSANGFTYLPPPPVVQVFSPVSGGNGTVIQISGHHFVGTTEVFVGDSVVTSFVVLNDSTITAVLGNGGTGNVVVQTPYGTASLPGFSYFYPPLINGFLPTAAAKGDTVVIRGHNLLNITNVTFGNTNAANFIVVNDSLIKAIPDTGSSGSIKLYNPGGVSGLNGFLFIPAPLISSFQPLAAPANTPITIRGKYFTGASLVSFGGIAASSFHVVDSSTITAVLGNGASGNVLVKTPGGIAQASNFIHTGPCTVSDISGLTNVCTLVGSIDSTIYQINNDTTATYTWTRSSNLIKIIGSNNHNSIIVKFDSAFVSGALAVTVVKPCGTFVKKINIYKNVLATPAVISGPSNPCAFVGSAAGTIVTYSIPPVSGATQYTWTLPVYQMAVSGGTSPFTTSSPSVNVFFGAGYTSDTLKVLAYNNCATSLTRTLKIAVVKPLTPGTISGSTDGCALINSNSDAVYTIRKVANAANYTWTAPPFASITAHPGGYGTENDTIVRVLYSHNFTGGNLSVSANSNCYNTPARLLPIKFTTPPVPSTIATTRVSLCPNRQYQYRVLSVAGATSYEWVVPSNATIISGSGTNSITVNYSTAATVGGDVVAVRTVNQCGYSAWKSLNIVLPSCSSPLVVETPALEKTVQVPDIELNDIGITAVPNPTNDVFELRFSFKDKSPATVTITDAGGRILLNKEGVINGSSWVVGNNFKPGLYFVHVLQNNASKVIKLIKL